MTSPARPSGVITITTDFGHQGPFVGVMKGVILTRFPEARIVDLTHEIVVHWPAEAGFWLARAFEYFPPGTVHIAVVDPGVGTSREIVAVSAHDHVFLAPDNGLLAPVIARHPSAAVIRFDAQRIARLGLHRPSATFHGRDIFAPVAGWLSKGVAPSEFGPEISDYVQAPLPQVERVGENSLRGVIVKVDKFGNLITNIAESDVFEMSAKGSPVSILISGQTLTRICRSYAEGGEDEVFAIVGSSGYLELAAKQASAAEKLAASVGSPVGVVAGQS